MTSVGSGAKEYLVGKLVLDESVTSIGNNAFSGCTSLTTIYYKGSASGAPWSAPNAKMETNFKKRYINTKIHPYNKKNIDF